MLEQFVKSEVRGQRSEVRGQRAVAEAEAEQGRAGQDRAVQCRKPSASGKRQGHRAGNNGAREKGPRANQRSDRGQRSEAGKNAEAQA